MLRFFVGDIYKIILYNLFILLTPALKRILKSPSDGAETQLNLWFLQFGNIIIVSDALLFLLKSK